MVLLLCGVYISENALNLFFIKISLGERQRSLPLGFSWLFRRTVVVSGGRKENMGGINRSLWVKSRKC